MPEIIKKYKKVWDAGIFLSTMIIATAFGYFFQAVGFSETNTVIIYMLAVLVTARVTDGWVYGMAASLLATLSFNFFFTMPYFSLQFYQKSYLITFLTMTVTALVTSTLTARVKMAAQESAMRELEMKGLYALTNHLSHAGGETEVANIAVRSISAFLQCNAACVIFDDELMPDHSYPQYVTAEKRIIRKWMPDWKKLQDNLSKLSGEFLKGAEFFDWPLKGEKEIMGAIRIPAEYAYRLTEHQLRLLHSMVEIVEMSLDRMRTLGFFVHRGISAKRRFLNRKLDEKIEIVLPSLLYKTKEIMDKTPAEDERMPILCEIYKDANILYRGMQAEKAEEQRTDAGKVSEQSVKAVAVEKVAPSKVIQEPVKQGE